MQYYGLTRGRAVSITLDGKFQQIMLDPEVHVHALTVRIYIHAHVHVTLGAHAQEGYVLRVRLSVSVCLSVMTFSATSFVSTLEFRYVRVYYRLFLIFNSSIFDKPFRSEVMA